MTNLDRLKDSPFLFQGLVENVEKWAGLLIASGEFEENTETNPGFDFELPEELNKFYELAIRFPFLRLGSNCHVLSKPVILDSGHIVFSKYHAVYQQSGSWELWRSYPEEREYDDADAEYESYELTYKLEERLVDNNLAEVLVKEALHSMGRYPWGLIPGRTANWNSEVDGFEFLKSLLNEKTHFYHQEEYQSWSWHPKGIIFNERRLHMNRQDLPTVNMLFIGTSNPSVKQKLLSEGCEVHHR